jgi:soluble lytic murein transglycosylase-like protein
LALLNFTVAFVGETIVFPLSPFFVREKIHALKTYALHRVRCIWVGHQDLESISRGSERRYGLPSGLMSAVVWAESNNRPHRISPTGAMGPAQLMPQTALELAVRDPFDPQQSIDGGARYLRYLIQLKGRTDLAVASYNAGPGAVNGRVPNIAETRHYVARVMQRWRGQADPISRARSSRSR